MKEISYDELYDLYIVQNISKIEVAKTLNVSEPTISNYLKKYNIHKTKEQIKKCREKTNIKNFGVVNCMQTEIQKQKLSKRLRENNVTKEINFDEIKKTYIDNNMSVKETALHFGVSESTIKKNIKKYNLSKTSEQIRKFKYGKNKLKKEDLYNYYIIENHSIEECAQKFSMSLSGIKFLINKYDIHKVEDLRLQKIENTMIKKYNVKRALQVDKFKKKAKNTNTKRYGSDNFSKSKVAKQNNLEKYGYTNYMQTEEFKQKSYATKDKNHSWNTSKPENKFYKKLIKKYGKKDIVRQYRDDERYPFNCDFYIKSKDLFIELNLSWTHGGHPFDKTNIDDTNKLNIWKDKNTEYYDNAIETWTIRDPLKLKTAKDNKLNYVMYYTEEEALNANIDC